MKRRDFLKSSLIFASITSVFMKASGVFSRAIANAKVMVKDKKPAPLGYKAVAPDNQVKAGKQCKTCKWFTAKEDGLGLCTLVAMQNVMKTKEAYVEEVAYCNMWAKKA